MIDVTIYLSMLAGYHVSSLGYQSDFSLNFIDLILSIKIMVNEISQHVECGHDDHMTCTHFPH